MTQSIDSSSFSAGTTTDTLGVGACRDTELLSSRAESKRVTTGPKVAPDHAGRAGAPSASAELSSP